MAADKRLPRQSGKDHSTDCQGQQKAGTERSRKSFGRDDCHHDGGEVHGLH